MGRHIVWTLYGVAIRKILRREVVERGFQVPQDVRVSVFIDRERSGSVLDEHVKQTDSDRLELFDRGYDFLGDEVKAAASGL
jgi:hypothetical protein